LLAELARLPDFTATLAWELRSPLFAPLLRRFGEPKLPPSAHPAACLASRASLAAPSDNYALTKRGASLRVDGTLKGLSDAPGGGGASGSPARLPVTPRGRHGGDNEEEEDDDEASAHGGLLPRWERGSFSLLIDPQSDGPTRLWYADHDKREVVNAQPLEAPRSAAQLAADVKEMLEGEPLGRKSKLKLRAFDFAPLRTWRGGARRESAEGWPDCAVYGAKGRIASEEKCCGDRSQLVAAPSYDVYLARVRAATAAAAACAAPDEEAAAAAAAAEVEAEAAEEAESEEAEVEAAAEAAAVAGGEALLPPTAAEGKSPKTRRFRGTIWLASGHPLSVRNLFPLFDICAAANKVRSLRPARGFADVLSRLHCCTSTSIRFAASSAVFSTWTPAPFAFRCRFL
jgi:hypothetical protein